MNPALWLIGEHPATLDPERRLLLAAPLRHLLNPTREDRVLMASLEPEGCAALREEDAWNRHVEDLRARADGGSAGRRVLMLLAATSARVRIDRQGRVRLPDPLLGKIGLALSGERQEAVISGNFADLRIWSRASWERFETEAREQYATDLELLRTREPDPGLRAV